MNLVIGTAWLPYGLLTLSGVPGSGKTTTVLTLISIMQAVEVDVSNLAQHITSPHTKPESDNSERTCSQTEPAKAQSPKHMQPREYVCSTSNVQCDQSARDHTRIKR